MILKTWELDEGAIFRNPEADHYWSQLDETLQEVSIKLQTDLMQVTKAIANCMKQSTLLSEADRRDLGLGPNPFGHLLV